jgi:hypothetical protein
MKRRYTSNNELLMQIEADYFRDSRMIVFVKADKRPWRELKPGERWALDVERVEGAGHVQEEYAGHWRVTNDPEDIGRRPGFGVPVRYFYFIHQERPPGEQEWKYDPQKAAQF